eukprot:4585385-Amphidinium_carterae.1
MQSDTQSPPQPPSATQSAHHTMQSDTQSPPQLSSTAPCRELSDAAKCPYQRNLACQSCPSTSELPTDLHGLGAYLGRSNLKDLECSKSRLLGVMCKHVDDLKIATEATVRRNFVNHLTRYFGKPDEEVKNFVNCGVAHSQSADGSVVMDQCKFIAAIRPCILPSRSKSAEANEKLTEEERRIFLSLQWGFHRQNS